MPGTANAGLSPTGKAVRHHRHTLARSYRYPLLKRFNAVADNSGLKPKMAAASQLAAAIFSNRQSASSSRQVACLRGAWKVVQWFQPHARHHYILSALFRAPDEPRFQLDFHG